MRRALAAGALAFVLPLGGIVIQADDQDATAKRPARTSWVEPYGGCKEAANYRGTRGWRECARHGLLPHQQRRTR